MLNSLIPYVLKLRDRYPRIYNYIVALGKRQFGKRLGVYPRPMAGEIAAVAEVLRGSRWNMTAGSGLPHDRLEAAFAEYIGSGYAVAVNTGGVALQMSMRALGLKHGDEVIQQVDTCSASALAVMAAGCTPLFSDIDQRTLMLDTTAVESSIGERTKAVLATHMWGNPENMPALHALSARKGLHLIEDACLSLGATLGGRKAGSFGRVGVFSFGCIKPIQGGEGGMIVTDDEALARELRSMRHWGDRTLEFGTRDTIIPCWNGRMSEIVAAVVAEQLKGYPSHLHALRTAVADFQTFLERIDGLDLVLGNATSTDQCAYTQVVLQLDEAKLGSSKRDFMTALYARGVPVWHANFELTNSLTLFRENAWEDWLPRCNLPRTRANYQSDYPVAQKVFQSTGIGLGKMNFLSNQNLLHLMRQIEALALHRAAA